MLFPFYFFIRFYILFDLLLFLFSFLFLNLFYSSFLFILSLFLFSVHFHFFFIFLLFSFLFLLHIYLHVSLSSHFIPSLYQAFFFFFWLFFGLFSFLLSFFRSFSFFLPFVPYITLLFLFDFFFSNLLFPGFLSFFFSSIFFTNLPLLLPPLSLTLSLFKPHSLASLVTLCQFQVHFPEKTVTTTWTKIPPAAAQLPDHVNLKQIQVPMTNGFLPIFRQNDNSFLFISVPFFNINSLILYRQVFCCFVCVYFVGYSSYFFFPLSFL